MRHGGAETVCESNGARRAERFARASTHSPVIPLRARDTRSACGPADKQNTYTTIRPARTAALFAYQLSDTLLRPPPPRGRLPLARGYPLTLQCVLCYNNPATRPRVSLRVSQSPINDNIYNYRVPASTARTTPSVLSALAAAAVVGRYRDNYAIRIDIINTPPSTDI